MRKHGPVTHIVLHFLIPELSTNESLEREDSVGRVDDSLALGRQTNQAFAVLGESDDRRCRPCTLSVLDDASSLAFHDRDAGVGRTQVDTNDRAYA